MADGNKKPWYKDTHYLGLIIAIVAIVVTIFIWLWPNSPPPPSDFSLSIDPMLGAIQAGGVIQTTVSVMGISGYDYTVSLSATGQPSGVVTAFVPPFGAAKPSYTSSVTMNVDKNVPAGDYTLVIKGTGANGKEHSCNYTLTVKSSVTPTPPLTPTATPPPPFIPLYVPEAYYPSGWMGDWGDITLDDSYTANPHSDPICIKISYSAAKSQGEGWAEIYWQHPDSNWGDRIGGYDLTDATKLTFWARGENGGEKAEFKVGGIEGEYPDSLIPPASTGVVSLSDNWQQYTIDLAGKDLSHIIGGFCWVTNEDKNPSGCTIYLDDIRYE